MKRRHGVLLLTALLIGGLAACSEESSLLGPNGPQQTELELSVDPDLTEATIFDAEAAIDAAVAAPAPVSGVPDLALSTVPPDPELVAEARELLRQARERFAAARRAWVGGDTERAAELAQEARELVAEALILVFGEEAYDRLLERVDQVISWLEERVDEENSDLLARIQELRGEAEALRGTDLLGATERLVLALQIANRERVHQRRQELAQHARLSVFMANSAVELAAGIAGDDATDRQIHALKHAQHMAAHALQALNAGRFRFAMMLAREAVNISLVAVMLEPGIEGNRLQAMIELSERAIAAAEEAVAGLDPGSFQVRLLEHAKRLQARAIEIADTHPRRAIHVLWHASVTAYGVIQLSS